MELNKLSNTPIEIFKEVNLEQGLSSQAKEKLEKMAPTN